jgi:hypothetical protein
MEGDSGGATAAFRRCRSEVDDLALVWLELGQPWKRRAIAWDSGEPCIAARCSSASPLKVVEDARAARAVVDDRRDEAREPRGDLIDDVDGDPPPPRPDSKARSGRCDEGRVLGAADHLEHRASVAAVARPRSAGDLAQRVQLVVSVGVRVCVATLEPNSTCTRTASRNAGSEGVSAASSRARRSAGAAPRRSSARGVGEAQLAGEPIRTPNGCERGQWST